jgi:glycosyltransferase involved in cell wall biosynthesis
MISVEPNKKRVLLVIRWPVGGIRTFARYVYQNFDSSRWHFTIIAPDLDETKIMIDDLSRLHVEYLPVTGIPNDGSSGFWLVFRAVFSLLLKKNYDLVHSHGFISGMCAALPAFLSRTPHVMTAHETFNEKQFAGIKGKTRYLGMAGFLRLINIIHSVSEDAQMNLQMFFRFLTHEERKCVVIPNGIHVESFAEANPRDLRRELNLDDDVFLIGFLGRFMSPKGFRYLVDAVDSLKSRATIMKPFLVLTFGEGGFIREEKQAIEERGLKRFFRFMPFTRDVAAAIKGLDVIVMPSLWEACPLQPMEALVCGTPIIGSDCLGLREVLKGTPAKVVPRADAISLANALEQEMKESSRDICVNFRKLALQRFDAKNTSQAISKLYEHLTHSHQNI